MSHYLRTLRRLERQGTATGSDTSGLVEPQESPTETVPSFPSLAGTLDVTPAKGHASYAALLEDLRATRLSCLHARPERGFPAA